MHHPLGVCSGLSTLATILRTHRALIPELNSINLFLAVNRIIHSVMIFTLDHFSFLIRHRDHAIANRVLAVTFHFMWVVTP